MGEKAVTELKRELRAAVRSGRRDGFSCGDAHSRAVIELIKLRGYQVVAAYEEFDNEPSMAALRSWGASNGVLILSPVIVDDFKLEWAYAGQSYPLGLADLIVVPGLAAGIDGGRLGRGKGYYDRALAETTAPRVIAVHDSEIFDSVPTEAHDKPMDAICSCSGIRFISPRLK